ncbi:hypothetical protein [Rhizobium phaseoli]|uniref:hypothetical protein n=1 Tax=Rhizobium phaseoli TaxID=396 RepID=UPI000635FB09|nr:hypothetical protein [Rhizobium phaseoli]KKZ89023.1 hypothetical protein RPHASCH2410_CH00070 [Rhizobium phaseoli Ch24-10]
MGYRSAFPRFFVPLVPLDDGGLRLPQASPLGVGLGELDALLFAGVEALGLAVADHLAATLFAAGAEIGDLAGHAHDIDEPVAVEGRATVDYGEAAKADHRLEAELGAGHDGNSDGRRCIIALKFADQRGGGEARGYDSAPDAHGFFEGLRHDGEDIAAA